MTARGYSVYPFAAAAVAGAAPLLDGLKHSKGAVAFTDAHPLPPAAFDALVLARGPEIDARRDA